MAAVALGTALVYTIAPVGAATLGGAYAAWRPPGAALRSIVQHTAAGVVFAAAAGELLPDLVHAWRLPFVLAGAVLGVALMLVLKEIGEWAKGPAGLIAVTAVDVFIDGLVVGIAFVAGAKQGVLLTIALSIEILFLGLSVSAALVRGNASRTVVAATSFGLGLLLPLGAAIGLTGLSDISGGYLAGFFAFGLVALLYLVVEELLAEAHEAPDTPMATAMFFVGFFLLLVLEETVIGP
jgi:ZIP family zinc transporter